MKEKKGELMRIERAPHTWADYRAHIYMYPERAPYGTRPGYYERLDFCGYSKKEIVDKLRAGGISCPRRIANH